MMRYLLNYVIILQNEENPERMHPLLPLLYFGDENNQHIIPANSHALCMSSAPTVKKPLIPNLSK